MIFVRLFAAGALIAGALLTAQPASASAQDDALLAALSAAGIQVPSPDVAIFAANLACNPITRGFTRNLIAQQVNSQTPLDSGQSKTLVAIAFKVYCPWRS